MLLFKHFDEKGYAYQNKICIKVCFYLNGEWIYKETIAPDLHYSMFLFKFSKEPDIFKYQLLFTLQYVSI